MNHLEPPFSSNRPIGNVLRAEIGKLDAEIERLWAELTASGRRAVLMQAEIERLNAALDEIADMQNIGDNWLDVVLEMKRIARTARSNEKESN